MNGKGKKSCYIAKEETDNESKSNDEEVVNVTVKEDYDEDEKNVRNFLSTPLRICDNGLTTSYVL